LRRGGRGREGGKGKGMCGDRTKRKELFTWERETETETERQREMKGSKITTRSQIPET